MKSYIYIFFVNNIDNEDNDNNNNNNNTYQNRHGRMEYWIAWGKGDDRLRLDVSETIERKSVSLG